MFSIDVYMCPTCWTDSLIVAGNSFQMVGAEKLKESLQKLLVQEGIDKRLSEDSVMVGICVEGF